MAFHFGDENNKNNNNNKGEYLRCIGWMEKNDTTASPKIGILLTNSGIFCDLRNFDFVFWKLRNSFLLARGPCRPCQQNFDLKFDFDVSTESGILQIQKKVDLVEKLRFCAKTCPRMERVLDSRSWWKRYLSNQGIFGTIV